MANARERILGLLMHSRHPLSGGEIGRVCGLWSGRLYVALYALERAGLVTGRWEDGPYPRRRLYQLVETRHKGSG